MNFRARLTAVRSGVTASGGKTVVQLTIEAPNEVPAGELQEDLGEVVDVVLELADA